MYVKEKKLSLPVTKQIEILLLTIFVKQKRYYSINAYYLFIEYCCFILFLDVISLESGLKWLSGFFYCGLCLQPKKTNIVRP